MSGSKHTPGPWSVSKDGDDYNITYNDDGNWLATVYDDDDPFEGRPEADARLIASAPELLEALKALASEEWSEMDDDDLAYELSQGNEMVRSYIAARAALAKAEGRS